MGLFGAMGGMGPGGTGIVPVNPAMAQALGMGMAMAAPAIVGGGLLDPAALAALSSARPGMSGAEALAAMAQAQADAAKPPPANDSDTTLDVANDAAAAAQTEGAGAAPAGAVLAANGKPSEPPKRKDADGKNHARDFSFLVTEDKQETGVNLTMLDDDSDDSDDDSEAGEDGEKGEPDPDEFEAGSAIDQLLYAQRAVTGMEKRRPGENAEQFQRRRIAGLRMLNAEAGSSDAKKYENDVDVAIMNANTQWHWGAGDNDADLEDDDDDAAPLALTSTASETLQLTFKPPEPGAEGSANAIVPAGGAAGGGALVAYDPEATVVKKRTIIGSEGIRASGALVPRATKDCLSNDKLRPVDSGRGFALLEKMGWKAGQGLGRSNTGTTMPVEAMIKTDMGGLRVDGEERVGGGALEMIGADGPSLSDSAFAKSMGGMMGQAAAASMDNEFSSITSQTKSVQQINEENRRRAQGLPVAPSTTAAVPPPAAPPAATMPPPSAPPQAVVGAEHTCTYT